MSDEMCPDGERVVVNSNTDSGRHLEIISLDQIISRCNVVYAVKFRCVENKAARCSRHDLRLRSRSRSKRLSSEHGDCRSFLAPVLTQGHGDWEGG